MNRPSETWEKEREKRQNERQEKIKKAQMLVNSGVEKLRSSKEWADYLKFHSRFHNYSFRNLLLIYLQKPDTKLVMGYRGWEKNGRHVMKGEKGILILAPVTYGARKSNGENPNPNTKAKDDEETEGLTASTRTVTAFRPAYVFDVSQTEGEPLPEVARELKGTSREILGIRQATTALLQGQGFSVSEKHITAFGYVQPSTKEVVTREGLEDMQAMKTLLHESAHVVLGHEPKEEKSWNEIEAESVAFIVADYFGFDTSSYSFGYISGYLKTPEQLIVAGNRIQAASENLIERIEEVLMTREKIAGTVSSNLPAATG